MPREIIFTHKCTGDLGIALREEGGETEVISMLFYRSTDRGTVYAVHNVKKGGLPGHFSDQATALNAMLNEAEEQNK